MGLFSNGRPLAGKSVLVTGAGTGVGRAAALAFAEAGAALSICGRRQSPLEDTAAEARTFEVPVQVRALDVADAAAVEAWVAEAKLTTGRIDALLNCAGTNVTERTWENTSLASWDEQIATNLTGIFLTTRAVLPTFRAQRDGLVINVASVAGIQASLVSGVAYSASKFGAVSLTQSLNLEEWQNGIRATVVCPGDIATPLMKKRPIQPPAGAHALMIQPEDLGATLLFVATLPPRVVIEQIIIRPTVRQY